MIKSKLTLKADFKCGEGSVGNIEKWNDNDPLLRCGILKGWIYDLEELYAQSQKEFFKI